MLSADCLLMATSGHQHIACPNYLKFSPYTGVGRLAQRGRVETLNGEELVDLRECEQLPSPHPVVAISDEAEAIVEGPDEIHRLPTPEHRRLDQESGVPKQ